MCGLVYKIEVHNVESDVVVVSYSIKYEYKSHAGSNLK